MKADTVADVVVHTATIHLDKGPGSDQHAVQSVAVHLASLKLRDRRHRRRGLIRGEASSGSPSTSFRLDGSEGGEAVAGAAVDAAGDEAGSERPLDAQAAAAAAGDVTCVEQRAAPL